MKNLEEIIMKKWEGLIKAETKNNCMMIAELKDYDENDAEEWDITPESIEEERAERAKFIRDEIETIEEIMEEAGFDMNDLHHKAFEISCYETERLNKKLSKHK